MPSHIMIEQMELGPMQNYIYFIGDTDTKEIAIVDPAWEVDTIAEHIDQNGLIPKAIVITHGHPDHTNGIDGMLAKYDIPVYVSKHEAYFYKPVGKSIREAAPGDTLTIGKTKIDFLHTPGHTPGSQCFLVHGNLVSGDTLFLDGCGRCDLPGGDAEVMYETIANRLMKLPDKTVIYPGHNYHPDRHQTLKDQKKTNRFLKCATLDDFLRERVG